MSKSKLTARLSVRFLSLALAFSLGAVSAVHAQSAGAGQPDFDPATRLFSKTNPPLGSTPAATDPQAPLTLEEQVQLDQQKKLAELQAKREEAKKKAEAAKAAQKEREQAQKAAELKRMAALKQMREERMKEMKENREELAKLLQEEKDARKAYQDSKKSETGNTSQTDDDYRKAEKDRQKKIQELRHPKYNPMTLPADSSGSTSSSTAMPGTTTSGTGPNATTH